MIIEKTEIRLISLLEQWYIQSLLLYLSSLIKFLFSNEF